MFLIIIMYVYHALINALIQRYNWTVFVVFNCHDKTVRKCPVHRCIFVDKAMFIWHEKVGWLNGMPLGVRSIWGRRHASCFKKLLLRLFQQSSHKAFTFGVPRMFILDICFRSSERGAETKMQAGLKKWEMCKFALNMNSSGGIQVGLLFINEEQKKVGSWCIWHFSTHVDDAGGGGGWLTSPTTFSFLRFFLRWLSNADF